MENSEMLSVFAGMYKGLLEDVAKRVLLELDATITKRMAAERAELEAIIAARTLSSDDVEDQIATYVDQHIDIEHDIDRYMSNGFDISDYVDIEERVSGYIDEVDWKEKLNEVLSGATIQLA